MVTKEQVIEALRQVEDPELYLDIWFLGLVYDVALQNNQASIEMTFTSPLCPAGPMLVEQVKEKVGALGLEKVNVKVVFNPPWTPPDEVKALMGL